MHSKLYSIDGLYKIIRQYYVERFPYSVQINNIAIINNELKSSKSSASLSYDNQNLIFKNPNPTEKVDSVYGESVAVSLEKYLSNQQDREALVKDIDVFRGWLVREGYLYRDGENHIATNLLLRTYNLTK